MSASLDELTPIARIGRYDVLGRLATGGMAEVFLARASGPEGVRRHVVLKRVLPHLAEDPKLAAAFVSEARVVSTLSHPNLCALHDFGSEGGLHLVMEWVRGRSLRDAMTRAREAGERVPLPIAVHVASRVAAALHHAHVATDSRGRALGIVHRDVTPENVLVSYDGVPKLIDFGIAKSADDKRRTEAGVLKGKFAYISPEQYRGEPPDGRSDVFALSVCLFELLTGESLYERDSEYETVAAILIDPSVPSARERCADVPEALDAIVQRGLAKDRRARWQSADELAAALDAFAVQSGAVLRPADLAKWMSALFPGEAARRPTIDRKPPTGTQPVARRQTRSEEMSVMALGAELDLDEEALAARGVRRRRMFLVLAVLLALASVAVIAAVALRPRAEAPGPAAAG